MTMRPDLILRFLFVTFLAASLIVGAAATLGVQTRTGEWVEITGEQDDMVFAAASKVKLSLTTPDDVFAVGADIEVMDVAADHLSLAGGDIVMSGLKVKDVLALGADVLIVDGVIDDDLIAAAADLDLGAGLTIAGSAVISGADISIESEIGGELRAAGERVLINAPIAGDVTVRANRLRLGPDARLSGDLRHGSEELVLDDGAIVSGQTIRLTGDIGPDIEPAIHRFALVMALFGLLLLLGLLVLVLAAVGALPALMNRSRDMLSDRPWHALGIGFLITVIGPALIALLFATVFGIPLALLIGAICAALAPLAMAASIYWTGQRASRVLASDSPQLPGLGSRLVWTAMAAIAFAVAALIPIVGGVVWLLAFVFGLGAVATQMWQALSSPEGSAALP